MRKKVLIVEDQFVEAKDLQLMLAKAGYEVCGIARSVPIAQEIIKKEKPALVLLDIFLKGTPTGIDLAIASAPTILATKYRVAIRFTTK